MTAALVPWFAALLAGATFWTVIFDSWNKW